jgi:hypothetical protein
MKMDKHNKGEFGGWDVFTRRVKSTRGWEK